MSGLLAPLRSARTGREAAFLLSGLPLGIAWMTALTTAWSLTLGFAVTPLVVPALIGVGLLVRGCATVEGALAGELLGVSVRPGPRRPPAGWLRRAWATLGDPWMWRAQTYLLLRLTLGFAIATGLVAVVASVLFLVFAPVFFWSIPEGIDVGLYRVHTLPEALPLVPVGLVLLLATAWAIHAVSQPWRALAPVLLGREDGPVQTPTAGGQQQRSAPTMQAVRIHALATGSFNLFLIVIWALTSRGYFWPVWPLLTFAAPLGIHAWVTVAVENRDRWRQYRLNTAFAIHAGVWVVFFLFLVGVWAASGAGYFWPVWPLLVGLLAVGSQLAVLLLGERERLTSRISTLETTRAGAVDVQEAELRRIERDLHDGAQARLVALGMSIGMAEQKLETDAAGARELLADARAGAGEALRELRDLARGIHPPVLADRGLDAAIRALAAASPLAVTVSVTAGERPRPPVESAAYFVVAEALANAGKHANARRIDVRVAQAGETLAVEVHDDGVGGADPQGGGLSGLRRRVEALDGSLTVLSPRGGPTTIRAELPCG